MTLARALSIKLSVAGLLGYTLCAIPTALAQPLLPPAAPEAPTPAAPGEQPVEGSDEHDVLTRGPIHEAFAEPYSADPVEGLIVSKPPPEPINEVPPETMPEGNNVQWIPGYPAWDDEREEYIWISGLWRDVPPNQRWMPGYWNQVPNGYQWVSGFWTNAETTELEYLPKPPASLEQGPNIAAPSDNHFWVPGSWDYYEDDYRWRTGYWAPAYDDWVWVPDRYVWTPHGYVFCSGYYDYRLPVRAVAFAPVYFNSFNWWYQNPYVPSVVLDVGPLTMHWFVRPSYCHYYFGDYYADSYYSGWGLQPWYTCNFGFGGFSGWGGGYCRYDPLLVFYSGYHRRHHGIDFGRRMHRWHDHYRNNRDFRPRRTIREQRRFLADLERGGRGRDRIDNLKIGRDFDDLVRDPGARHGRDFVKLDGKHRDRHTKVARETVQLATLRHGAEAEGGRRDGRRRGNDQPGDTIALPGATDASGSNKGRGRKTARFKLPENQGAGDQTLVNETAVDRSKKQSRRNNVPDGPPGGRRAVTDRNGSENPASRRGRSLNNELSGQNAGADNNQNSSSRRGRRGSQNDPQQFTPSTTQNNGGSGTTGQTSRGRSRSLDSNRKLNQQPQGNAPALGNQNNDSRGSGSDRNSRRGRSENQSGGGQSGLQVQPLQQGGGGSNRGDSGNRNSRSRSNHSSGSSFQFNNNGNPDSGGPSFRSRGGGDSGSSRGSSRGDSNRGSSRRNNGSGSSSFKSDRGSSSSGNFQVFGNTGSNNNGPQQRSSRSRRRSGSSSGSLNSRGGGSSRSNSFNSGGGGSSRGRSFNSGGGGSSRRNSVESGGSKSSRRNSASSGGGSRSRSSGRSSGGSRNRGDSSKSKKSKR